MLVGLQHS